ncbi:cadherin-87A [Diabrotica virgifera virgifera]|uniref:Cadherin domain-containing protein n=1 Tax=Diabrotica virgifera virgifera TaxID=50390 RepID=A0ABM5ID15_DIAVI|nr:cadherin-87A [Diabrotica virgifera virgifera]XP_028130158.2 cadherin-87A [Diabrotica virgifera virgifera]XP_050507097.1 cadherin-87A [Diabrotica virgifera virgifera]XP_050507098.1 cadherin-87A [Diabrotica virgifera virgifera]XP_050507100.1 cadherin-87A [Diabrotica virgifera virgifera]XP_050507101.1 cadherin-87A [Diabrotica virgifera virgifera]XP_050507102.1 cadherin-87A [Diabrotica virgifera virgifera]XP_050507103.1 cadherin-87A [Diabrotica virgifera virgifera]
MKFWSYLLIFLIKGCLANLPPLFTMDMNNYVLSENTPVDSVIYTLQGTDPENSHVHYGMSGTDTLSVNSTTGEVTVVKPLDYEKNNTLNIIVSIEDEVEGGGKNNIVEVPITVIISDENDNPPEFIEAPYEFTVNEDTLPGAKVFSHIMVVDKDTTGSNIEVECITLSSDPDACDVFNVEAINSEQNLYTGAITLMKKLDYNAKSSYHFMIKASDGELTSTTNVDVKVGDVQDTPPYFVGNLTAEIKEDVSINTLVMTVHAEDGDRGNPRKIVYELVNNPMDYFLLDSITGELRTARPIDKESIDNPGGILKFNIRAYEVVNGSKSNTPLTVSTAEATVRIIDVNDEPPTFNKREYTVEIPENIPEGSALPGLDMTVNDPDEDSNSEYSLDLIDISEVFSIEPKTASGWTPVTIRVANSSLDYEDLNQRKFIILAVAKELRTQEKLSSTATVTITVVDVNDNAPSFDQEAYSATISEVATPGTLVTTITASDRDSGSFGENGIVYKLFGNGADKFNVNSKTGTITVAECEHLGKSPCLDYETNPEFQLQFMAVDDDGKGQTSTVPLKIQLTDSNDNPPVFSQSIYRAFINEGSAKFQPELIVEAADADKTSRVTYSIISGNDDGLFSVVPTTGVIRIMNNRGLDISNETDNVISLTVMASDGQYTSTAVVNITVLDVNNNAPIFTRHHYVESVLEDVPIGTSVMRVEATDADTGINAAIEYFMQKGAYEDFKVDNASGVISVAKKLDYDRRNTYNIELVALDHGVPSLTGTTEVTITVVNTNDKDPYFVPATQTAEVMEDAAVGTVVYTLIALDPDVNSSDALNFAATEPITALDKHGQEVIGNENFKEFFSVDKFTGKVTVVKPLLRDLAAIIRITVLVSDITAPSIQQGQGLLIITIGDVNDSPPVFMPPWTKENPSYYLELKEEQPVGTIVATYKAIDEDSDIAGYLIQPESDYFQINNGTGIVQIKKKIDYEKLKILNFTIVAFDSGVPQLNATATVLVKVLNINDNDPIFTEKEYKAEIDENSPNGTFVVAVRAVDKDAESYGEVSYFLTGEHSMNFAIDNETGYITVANSNFLDHEVINETEIQVVAQDGAPSHVKRSVTVPVRIRIRDVNDNAPKFAHKEYNVTVMENVRLNPPLPLVQVNATDEDSGMNGNIHYSIVSGNDNDIFLLGVETGILYPHKSLLGQTRDFHLAVVARDGGGNGNGNGQLFDEATINVHVLNVNEHRPEFIMPALANSTVEVLENAATENYLVMTVKAVDKDQNENGRLTYHFKVDDENVQETEEFSIDPKSGELKTRKSLDREFKPNYQLVLVARDHGFPKWYETIRHLTVLLVDENDNRPEFPGSKSTNPYHFYVVENNEKDIMIGQVKALDRDEGMHAKVYYYLISGNEDRPFFLDRIDGGLYANKSFDREEQSEYSLLIIATNDPNYVVPSEPVDQEETDRSIAHVLVTILDVNDNPPTFEQPVYYSAVNAMANINDFVINVTATDPDFGVNGSITYYIKATNLFKFNSNRSSGSIIPSPFNITEQGQICTATYLAENNQHRFIIDIIARENAFPEREASTRVHVWIFEPEQLIRVILSRPKEEVIKEKEEILAELSNATQSLVIIDKIRYHIDDNGVKNEDWSDLYILVVNPKTQTILPVPDVLKTIDSKYDFLKDYYAGFAIENVVPAFITEKAETFDSALVALIALLVVLIVGIVTFIIICCCLRHWVLSPTDLKKKDALIKKAIIDDLNTTENPLWIEQKLKIYEEQELTMQVFNEPDPNMVNRRDSDDYVNEDNAYATIQHPTRRSSSHLAPINGADDLADYATLSGHPHNRNGSNNSSLRGGSNYYEAAMGFQGSTFQVPERLSNDYTPYGVKFDGSELTINKSHHQPDYVAELI